MTLATVPAHPRRLVYLGTPAMAVAPLEALVGAGFDLALVVTRADKRRGRGSDLSPSPVKEAAGRLGLRVSHRVDDALDVGADLGVVVAFGQLVRQNVLERLAMVNLHFSLLPRWRGAAPVERALLAGDTETGVCLMQLEEGLDTGPVFARAFNPIGPRTTGTELRADLVSLGIELLLDQLNGGLGEPVAQQGEPTYAAKLMPSELRLGWSRPAAELDRWVRLGGAWTTFRDRRLRIVEALLVDDPAVSSGRLPGEIVTVEEPTGTRTLVVAGHGALELIAVQPEGRSVMSVASWRNGARPGPDDRLGGPG